MRNSQPKGDRSPERVNSDFSKDRCKQRSETVGEEKNGNSGSSQFFESENLRSKPSVLSCPPDIAGDVEVKAMLAPMESKVENCREKVQEVKI